MSAAKFRPSLSSAQILYILELVQRESATSPIARSIIRVIGPMSYKIKEQILSPAYVAAPPTTLGNKLGFEEPQIEPKQDSAELHMQWVDDPTTLTQHQLELIAAYRWENDLMSPEEETEYNNSLIQIAKGA